MKILKLYIENFGKFSQFKMNFVDGFNEVVEENGFGKTTLAVFIKSMFYGLPSTRKTKVSENERTKYRPWQGGNYGGYIDFEVAQSEYRIERFFGKNENEDTFKLIDLKTNKTSNKFSSKVGEELFDLDVEGYERCTFIPQKELTNGITDKLSTKLIGMIHGSENSESLKSSLEILDKRRQELKKKGGAGQIEDVESKIKQTLENIEILKQSEKDMEILMFDEREKKNQIFLLKEEKEKISKKISQNSEIQKLIANKKFIEDNNKTLKNCEEKLKSCEKVLNGNEVSVEQIKEYEDKNKKLSYIYQQLEDLEKESNSKEKRSCLEHLFSNFLPSEEQITTQIENVDNINKIKNQVENLKFQKQLESQKNQSSKTKNKLLFLPLLLSLACLIVGGVFVASNLIVGIVSFVVAFGLIVFSGFLYLKNLIEQKNVEQSKSYVEIKNEDIEQKENELQEREKSLNQFLLIFKNNEDNATTFLFNLLEKRKEYAFLQQQEILSNEKRKSLIIQCDQLNKEVGEYLGQFEFEGVPEYETCFSLLNSTIIERKRLTQEIQNLKQKLSEFEENLIEIPDLEVDEIDINELQLEEHKVQKEIDSCNQEHAKLLQRIDDIKIELQNMGEYENNLVELKNEKENLTNEFNAITSAKKFLEQANDNLSSKYLSPMKKGLNKYLKLVLGDKFVEYNIDTNLNVSFEEYGKSHELDYLSKGYQGIVDLCIRFALIDTLFSKEKPFIVLDDPFVNFDEQKLTNAVELIKKTAKEYQVLYLVCHNSRG